MRDSSEELLAAAHAALDRGSTDDARTLAKSVLDAALASGDQKLEAKALTCFAHCDRLLSNFGPAHETSARAVQLFQATKDVAGEATALAIQAHAASVRGRNEEAVEAALLSAELARRIGSVELEVVARVQLGIALFYGRAFDEAQQSFEAAATLGIACSPAMSPFQALVTQGCSEIVRVVTHRHETGAMPSLDTLRDLLRQCASLSRMLLRLHSSSACFGRSFPRLTDMHPTLPTGHRQSEPPAGRSDSDADYVSLDRPSSCSGGLAATLSRLHRGRCCGCCSTRR